MLFGMYLFGIMTGVAGMGYLFYVMEKKGRIKWESSRPK